MNGNNALEKILYVSLCFCMWFSRFVSRDRIYWISKIRHACFCQQKIKNKMSQSARHSRDTGIRKRKKPDFVTAKWEELGWVLIENLYTEHKMKLWDYNVNSGQLEWPPRKHRGLWPLPHGLWEQVYHHHKLAKSLKTYTGKTVHRMGYLSEGWTAEINPRNLPELFELLQSLRGHLLLLPPLSSWRALSFASHKKPPATWFILGFCQKTQSCLNSSFISDPEMK